MDNNDKKIMEFPHLDFEEINKQQAWLIIGNKKTRMLRKEKQPSDLLPSKIAMNIQWIPLLDKNMVSSVGLHFGYNSYDCSMLRYAPSVQALNFGFCVCFTIVTIQALDSLPLCQASLFLMVVSSGFATIFNTQPYNCIALGFLTSPFTKPHLGLWGGHCRQIIQIFIFSDLFGTKSLFGSKFSFAVIFFWNQVCMLILMMSSIT